MNDPNAAIALGRRIDLTREPDVVVGGVIIQPTACEVVADGRRIRLQPRVMQVLIALARAGGQPVSREALALVCWGDVTVGEDALNQLRPAAARGWPTAKACSAFAIETIPRIGYRLSRWRGDSGEPKADFRPAAAGFTGTGVRAKLPVRNDPDFLYFSSTWRLGGNPAEPWRDAPIWGSSGGPSSTSSEARDKAVGRVAAELGATHVLDGSVRRSGQRVRISAQLIDCGSRTTLWADRFDRELTDIFAVQDEIATRVALALDAALASAADIGKIDPTAYDLYLKSRAVRGGRHVPITEAIRLLERAVSLAPRLAIAWAALAHHRALANRDLGVDEIDIVVDRTEVVAAAEAALRLDPGCGLAYVALGTLLPFGDYQGREAALERALALGPRSSLTASKMGWFLASVGRNQEALQYAAQGLELDPLDEMAANAYSQLLTYVGRYDDSQRSYAVFREKWPLSPLFTIAPLNHAHLHGDRQTYDMLRRIAVDLGMSGKFVRQALASGDMRFDPTPRSRERIIEAIDGQIRNTGTVVYGALILAYAMGLRDEVFAAIERASFTHHFDENGPPPAATHSPGIIFDRSGTLGMMEDVRFVGFCAKLGLCDYWVKTDRWPDCADAGVLPYDFKAECWRLTASRECGWSLLGRSSTPRWRSAL